MSVLGIIICCAFSMAAGFFMGRACQCICDRALLTYGKDEDDADVAERVAMLWERVEILERKKEIKSENIRAAEPWTK